MASDDGAVGRALDLERRGEAADFGAAHGEGDRAEDRLGGREQIAIGIHRASRIGAIGHPFQMAAVDAPYIGVGMIVGIKVPVVVRLEGTNVEQGQKILKDSGLNFIVADGMKDAAEKVVAATKR